MTLTNAQTLDLGCKSAADFIGLDRKCWTGNTSEISESWQMDFQIGPAPDVCKVITGIDVSISFSGDASGIPGGCFFDWWTNIYVNCGGFFPCACSNSAPDLLFNTQGIAGSQSFGNPGSYVQFNDVISVDIVAVVNVLTPGCDIYQDAITQGLATGNFSICVLVHYGDDVIDAPVNLGNDEDLCFGETTDIDASGPYTNWAWNVGGSSSMLTGVGDGTYEVTVTDSKGCTDTDVIVITEFPELMISFDRSDPFFICEGDMEDITASVSGGSGSGYSFSWLTPQGNTSGSATVITDIDGVYNITVTDGAMCTKTGSITVNYHPDPIAMINAPLGTAFCAGSDIPLEGMGSGGSGSGYTYQWTTPSSTSSMQNILANEVGMYSLIVTDDNGCESTAEQINITEITPPNAGSDNAITVCNDQIDVDLDSYLGLHDFTGFWVDLDGSGINLANATSIDFSLLTDGVYNYQYTVTGTTPCMDDMANIEVTIVSNPNAGNDNMVSFCSVDGPIDFMSLIGNPDANGQWIDISGNGFDFDLTNAFLVDISSIGTGSYEFDYVLLATPPCNNASSTLTIDIEAAPNAGLSNGIPNNICVGSTVDFFNYLSNDPDLNGVWADINGAGVNLSDPNNVDFSTVPEGIYDFTYNVNGINCNFNAQTTITINVSEISAGINPDTMVCSGNINVDLTTYIDGSLGGLFIGESQDTLFSALLDTTGTPGEIFNIEYVLEANGMCPESRDTFSFIFSSAVDTAMISESYCDDPSRSVSIGSDVYDITNPSGLTTLQSIEGCDSIVMVDLIFNTSSTPTQLMENHCMGDGYSVMVGNQLFDESNPSGSVMLSNATNCDSIVNVSLNFLAPVNESISETRCKADGFSIVVGTEIFDETNPIGQVTLMGSNQCDSIVDVNLIFLDELSGTYEEDQCVGSGYSIMIGAEIFDETTPTGTATLTSSIGCDSIVTVQLNFINSLMSDFSREECSGNGYSIDIGTQTFDETNPMGQVTLQSNTGCDSLVTVNLNFNSNSNEDLNLERCKNDGFSITIGTEVFDESNPTGTVTLQNSTQCDSTINVNLVFQDEIMEQIIMDQCEGDGSSVIVGTEIFDESNPTGTVTLTSALGCDSIVFVELTYSDVLMSNIDMDQCSGDGFSLQVGTTVFDESNPTGSVNLVTSSNCDSIVEVNLVFNNPTTANVNEQRCQGDGYQLVIGNDTYDETNPIGQTTLPGANSVGCDSMVMVNLDYSGSVLMESVMMEFCETSGFQLMVGTDTYDINNPSGSTSLVTSTGCDSIVNVSLIFNAEVDSTFSMELCADETIMIGTEVISITNNPSQLILASANAMQCDTILNLDIQFNALSSDDQNIEICQGDSIFLENAWQFATGSYIDILLNSNNCDSILTTNLNVTACAFNYAIRVDSVSCFGLSDGLIHFEFVDAADFPYTIRLNQNNSLLSEQMILDINGTADFSSLPFGQYELLVIDSNGDFVGAELIDVSEPGELILAGIAENVSCFGMMDGSITFNIMGGSPNYEFGNPLVVNNEISDLEAGDYTFMVMDQNSCSDEYNVTISEPEELRFELVPLNPTCGSSNGSITIMNSDGGTGPYEYAIDNEAFSSQFFFENLREGSYSIQIKDQNDCISVAQNISLSNESNLTIDLEDEVVLDNNDGIELNPIINFTPEMIVWSPSEGLSCADCLLPLANPDESTLYIVEMEDINGCVVIDSVLVRKELDIKIYVPDSFSPNNDGVNDRFDLGFKDAVNYDMEIYDRWGNKVYFVSDQNPNEMNSGWDGKYQQKDLGSGVYIYKITINLINNEQINLLGNITLLR